MAQEADDAAGGWFGFDTTIYMPLTSSEPGDSAEASTTGADLERGQAAVCAQSSTTLSGCMKKEAGNEKGLKIRWKAQLGVLVDENGQQEILERERGSWRMKEVG